MASLHDAYELGGVAGHGRTTLVRLAVRRGDCQPVALKQLRMEHAIDPDKRGRFIRQYRRAAMLEHDNIETLLDIAEGDDGPVAVSEWVDGRSLLRLSRWRRSDDEPWHVSEVTVIASSLLNALHYAHAHPTGFDAQGMLHGGIWPGNVLLDVDGNVKLVDFGMAAVWQEAAEPWQDLEALRYLSVDHMRHGPSAASDLYAVGALVHELLSGQRFRGDCDTEAEMRAAIERPEPPVLPHREIPVPLERLRKGLLEPVPNPRVTLSHMLDLCDAIPAEGGQERLRDLVRAALRTDSAEPDAKATPSEGVAIIGAADGIAHARERSSAAAHLAVGGSLQLEQLPIGHAPQGRVRDTQSVPIPVEHEITAAREPMFLQQTAPPRGEPTRNAERRRSGPSGDPDADTGPIAQEVARLSAELGTKPGTKQPGGPVDHDADTTPLEESRTNLRAYLAGEDPPAGVPQEVADAAFDPDMTAEVTKVPQLPEDHIREQKAAEAAATAAQAQPKHWLRGPMGWALLGALAVGIGLPLVARCSPGPEPAPEPKPLPGISR